MGFDTIEINLVSYFFGWGWVIGDKAISTQVVIEVEVGVELGNDYI